MGTVSRVDSLEQAENVNVRVRPCRFYIVIFMGSLHMQLLPCFVLFSAMCRCDDILCVRYQRENLSPGYATQVYGVDKQDPTLVTPSRSVRAPLQPSNLATLGNAVTQRVPATTPPPTTNTHTKTSSSKARPKAHYMSETEAFR